MRIALVSPLLERVPPETYGGTERVVATLASTLSAFGHEVTVFATSDSHVDAALVGCRDRAMLTDRREHAMAPDHILMFDKVLKRAEDFDIIHFHTEFLHFPIFKDIARKTLTTCHSRLDLVHLPKFFRAYSRFPLISISESQRRPMPDANWFGTVHHGYPVDQYRAIPGKRGDRRGEYLAFLGRIAPEKGIEQAIEIAKATDHRLKIAARINVPDRRYWEECVEPKIDKRQIDYIGEIEDHQKSEFLSRATGLLFPINWPEPFGLVMIEAMACGTPIVAFDCGSVPEVIENGKTGSIVRNTKEAVDAVRHLGKFDSVTIRQAFEERFSATAMVNKYVEIYRRLLVDQQHDRIETAQSAALRRLQRDTGEEKIASIAKTKIGKSPGRSIFKPASQ